LVVGGEGLVRVAVEVDVPEGHRSARLNDVNTSELPASEEAVRHPVPTGPNLAAPAEWKLEDTVGGIVIRSILARYAVFRLRVGRVQQTEPLPQTRPAVRGRKGEAGAEAVIGADLDAAIPGRSVIAVTGDGAELRVGEEDLRPRDGCPGEARGTEQSGHRVRN